MEVKTQTQKPVKRKKSKFSMSEAQLGYTMVAPAIIIILLIAIYPVLRSFWYSMFDLRLNHPTKNGTHLSYQIDMERYYKNVDIVKGALKRASGDSTGDVKDRLDKAYNEVQTISDSLLKESEVAGKEKEVRSYVDNFKVIDSDKLKYAGISKTTAQQSIDKFNALIKDIAALKANEDIKVYTDKAAGLMEELRDSFISPNYIGFSNYAYFLKDKEFWGALRYTFSFTVISVFFEFVLGLGVATIINRRFKGRGIVRAAILIPWAIPTVVAAKMWRFLYDGQSGIIAFVMNKLHLISEPGQLLTTHVGASFAAIFADVWKTTPYMALLLLAGLQALDSSLYEASDVDGATKLQQFFKITLPLLKPTIMVALLFRTLDAFRVFDLIYVLTGGGNSTDTISTIAYKTMFAQMEFGKGSTLSVVVFLCVAVISIGYIKILGAEVLDR